MVDMRTKCWNYIHYGERGDYIENEENGRMILKINDYRDPFSKCVLLINGRFTGEYMNTPAAVDWLMEGTKEADNGRI